jgi:hypothetical protein
VLAAAAQHSKKTAPSSVQSRRYVRPTLPGPQSFSHLTRAPRWFGRLPPTPRLFPYCRPSLSAISQLLHIISAASCCRFCTQTNKSRAEQTKSKQTIAQAGKGSGNKDASPISASILFSPVPSLIRLTQASQSWRLSPCLCVSSRLCLKLGAGFCSARLSFFFEIALSQPGGFNITRHLRSATARLSKTLDEHKTRRQQSSDPTS